MPSANFSLASKIKLPNGKLMPQIHLGLYRMNGKEARASVRWALGMGYRGFDGAQMYKNEREAFETFHEFVNNNNQGVTRQEIFYTSKLASNSTNYKVVRNSIQRTVAHSKLGYIDMFLLHSPYGGTEARLTSWKAVEDAIEDGEVKTGGVSNFGVRHIEELLASNPRIPPAVNQIEVHPFNTQKDIRAACAKHGIVVQAYAPLAQGERLLDITIEDLSKKYSCTPAQLMIRWSLQHGLVPLPKTSKSGRLHENATIDGFKISKEDMEELDGLDEKLVTDWDPTDAP
ncbi:aldo-keto reductase family 1 member E1 [Jackrogersella minutella]|nr:aldo-keto reductase family 1 member E1 [Jackrogersella minutella]